MQDIDVTMHVCNCVRLGGERDWNWRQDKVSAPYWRLYWNRRPGGLVKVGGREWALAPKSIFVMLPRTIYSTRTTGETEHFYVHFSLGEPLDTAKPGFYELSDPLLLRLAGQARTALLAKRDSWRALVLAKALALSALPHLPEEALPTNRVSDPRIAQALAWMATEKDVSNREFAREAGMSLNSFLRLFQREVGCPPQVWFRRKRLERAAELLHFSEATIEEIAAATGFCDRYHFSRAFAQEYSVSPAKFRKQDLALRKSGLVRKVGQADFRSAADSKRDFARL